MTTLITYNIWQHSSPTTHDNAHHLQHMTMLITYSTWQCSSPTAHDNAHHLQHMTTLITYNTGQHSSPATYDNTHHLQHMTTLITHHLYHMTTLITYNTWQHSIPTACCNTPWLSVGTMFCGASIQNKTWVGWSVKRCATYVLISFMLRIRWLNVHDQSLHCTWQHPLPKPHNNTYLWPMAQTSTVHNLHKSLPCHSVETLQGNTSQNTASDIVSVNIWGVESFLLHWLRLQCHFHCDALETKQWFLHIMLTFICNYKLSHNRMLIIYQSNAIGFSNRHLPRITVLPVVMAVLQRL